MSLLVNDLSNLYHSAGNKYSHSGGETLRISNAELLKRCFAYAQDDDICAQDDIKKRHSEQEKYVIGREIERRAKNLKTFRHSADLTAEEQIIFSPRGITEQFPLPWGRARVGANLQPSNTIQDRRCAWFL